MFDYFRSSYDLGEEFTDVECQTKDIEGTIGGTMSFYWLDPAGHLWAIDERGVADPIMETEERTFPFIKWVPNGRHGKVRRHYITSYITIYRSKGELVDMRLHFKRGHLMDFERIGTRRNFVD